MDSLYPMQELIWTKVANMLCDTYPSLDQISPAEEFADQKAYFDHLWCCSLTEMVERIGNKYPPPSGFLRLSQETNEKNSKYKNELRSFPQTYDIELRGIIEIAGSIAADIVHSLCESEARKKLSPTLVERTKISNMCCNLLYQAFKKPEAKKILRCIHIGASIHAAMRWDKNRKFRANDYDDFEHATAALSYCDSFFTEAPLHHLLTRSHIHLEDVNGCLVFSNVRAAADYVKDLVSSP